MSNLIPTPRADKNGNVVIRHMKPEPVRSPYLPPLPKAPQIADAVAATHEESAREVWDALFALKPTMPIPSVDQLTTYFSKTEELVPEAASLIKRLLSTGDESGHLYLIGPLNRAVGRSQENSYFEAACIGGLKGMLEVWNEENVAVETGNKYVVSFSTRAVINENPLLSGLDDAYWRGLAATRLVKELCYGELRDEEWMNHRVVDDFCLAAGSHEALPDLINLAVERKTLNVEFLNAIMNDAETEKPLRDGLL